MFELLISVSGVGAKTALTMLAVIEPSNFALAVISEDIALLTKIPGIGAKSAQRIVLELKDKLKKEQEICGLTRGVIHLSSSRKIGHQNAIFPFVSKKPLL